MTLLSTAVSRTRSPSAALIRPSPVHENARDEDDERERPARPRRARRFRG